MYKPRPSKETKPESRHSITKASLSIELQAGQHRRLTITLQPRLRFLKSSCTAGLTQYRFTRAPALPLLQTIWLRPCTQEVGSVSSVTRVVLRALKTWMSLAIKSSRWSFKALRVTPKLLRLETLCRRYRRHWKWEEMHQGPCWGTSTKERAPWKRIAPYRKCLRRWFCQTPKKSTRAKSSQTLLEGRKILHHASG